MGLGSRLKKARKKLRLTQKQVADKIGIDDTTISKYENDKSEPDIETLKKLANLYEVSPQWLLVGYEIEIDRENTVPKYDAQTTIKLIEEEAAKMGLSLDDPLFKEMLSNAFKLLRLAQLKDSKKS